MKTNIINVLSIINFIFPTHVCLSVLKKKVKVLKAEQKHFIAIFRLSCNTGMKIEAGFLKAHVCLNVCVSVCVCVCDFFFLLLLFFFQNP